jgi:hypothetical protein
LKKHKKKTAYLFNVADKKLALAKEREQVVRELAGWLSHEEAQELRKAVEVFDKAE